ncbi:MAG: radical SAM protein, partial [Cyanobacteria bacterium]|nr:radical SAM protein [Cyanobacteriota bacterium]
MISQNLLEDLLEKVVKPGQYLGNEWGARHKPFASAQARLALAFPDIYELGMSNFGLKILYKLVNETDGLMADRTYAPGSDMEALLREKQIPLWCWESRQPVGDFELVGFSLQYELTYTNVLNMLELAGIPVDASERRSIFPLIFGGGPSAVNPEPMARFMDFFMIGDGEQTVPHAMQIIVRFKTLTAPLDLTGTSEQSQKLASLLRRRLLLRLSREVPGVYVPALYKLRDGDNHVTPLTATELAEYLDEAGQLSALVEATLAEQIEAEFPGVRQQDVSDCGVHKRVFRQVAPLSDDNQPSGGLVSYLSLVHDREVLEVRRGCDRGCRFCQPGYTFLPVRERSSDDILRLSKEGLAKSGHEEYSLLSLCVSDYTSLTDTVRSLNREHSQRRTSLSFPSQRADRMNLDVAEELKVVRKSGITLAPEAGTERLRAVINKGLSHEQIISAIEAAYKSGWNSVKLYFMCCLPTERDEDLAGIIAILHEATMKCRAIRSADPTNHNRGMEFTCTISNFVPKPHTPFQWFGQVDRMETKRKHRVLRDELEKSGLHNVTLNTTDAEISLLESVISRGGREMGDYIHRAWQKGAIFDAWDDRFQSRIWHEVAEEFGTTLEKLSCTDREVGSAQPWDVIHIGLHG